MKQNIANEFYSYDITNLNSVDKVVHKVWQTSHQNKIDPNDYEFEDYTQTLEFQELDKLIKIQFNALNSKYMEVWNFLHKLANKISRSLVIKEYKMNDNNFDLYQQEKRIIDVKMELFNNVENQMELSEKELSFFMGQAFNKLESIYNDFKIINNDFDEFQHQEMILQNDKLEKEMIKKYKKYSFLNINKKYLIIFFILTVLAVTILFVIVFLKINR